MVAGRAATLSFALLASGCYIEANAARYVEAGGVRGDGYSYGISLGAYADSGDFRLGSLAGLQASRTSAEDGTFEADATNFAMRGDATVHDSSENFSYRATGELGVATTDLLFHATGYKKDHTDKALGMTSFLGATFDLHGSNGKTSLTFSAGPATMTAFNDLVGTTTWIGPQARVGLWAFNGTVVDFKYTPPAGGASRPTDSGPPGYRPPDPDYKSENQKYYERRQEEQRKKEYEQNPMRR
jgi:hypothetical protein